MKLKSLHPKNKFLPFLSLSVLVIAGAVGIALLNQKQIFDKSEAKGGGGCSDECIDGSYEGDEICINNTIYTCSKRVGGRYSFKPTEKCPVGFVCKTEDDGPNCNYNCVIDHADDCAIDGFQRCNAGWVQRCTDGWWQNYKNCESVGLSCWYISNKAWCEVGSDPNPKPPPVEVPQGWCSQDCTTRYECTSEDGKIISGRCATGEVCCDFR